MILQERLKELFDYIDGDLYRKVSVRGAPAGKKVGAKQSNGYSHIIVDGKKVLSHRAIFLFFNGYLPECVDHIDGNKLNNAIENLRDATKSENGYNRKANKNSKSGIKNVRWIEKFKRWAVTITANKKRMYIGCYEDIELAELVAAESRNKFHGAFANHLAKVK